MGDISTHAIPIASGALEDARKSIVRWINEEAKPNAVSDVFGYVSRSRQPQAAHSPFTLHIYCRHRRSRGSVIIDVEFEEVSRNGPLSPARVGGLEANILGWWETGEALDRVIVARQQKV